MCNIDVIIPILFEFILQISIIGYNPILKEKLLNDFSYSKNMKFYCALFIISLFFGIIIVYMFSNRQEKKEKINDNKKETFKIWDLCGISIIPFFGFIIFTFFSSIFYYKDDNLKRERWNNIIMAEFIFFKVIDFQILSFFNFLDNSDIFNTTLLLLKNYFGW